MFRFFFFFGARYITTTQQRDRICIYIRSIIHHSPSLLSVPATPHHTHRIPLVLRTLPLSSRPFNCRRNTEEPFCSSFLFFPPSLCAVATPSRCNDNLSHDKQGRQQYRKKSVVRDSSISASVSNAFFITYIQQPRSRGLYRM